MLVILQHSEGGPYISLLVYLIFRYSDAFNCSSCCSDPMDTYAAVGGISPSSNYGSNMSLSHGTCVPLKHGSASVGYGQYFVSGWMYINEDGHMCGPYSQEQLCNGLSSGFLPEELPIYPVAHGSFMNPMPLKYLRQLSNSVCDASNFSGTTSEMHELVSRGSMVSYEVENAEQGKLNSAMNHTSLVLLQVTSCLNNICNSFCIVSLYFFYTLCLVKLPII